MGKEIAIGKRAKISEAQQYMILSVLGASVFLGVAISLVMIFINQISFNAKVVSAQDSSIKNYSDIIKKTGVCTRPSGDVYSIKELEQCHPDSIEVSQIPDTLRSEILTDLASNKALNSVPKEGDPACINSTTGKNYSYKELNDLYQRATTAEELKQASQRIISCSALRIIPDALPASENQEALLASLNRIFNISNWTPQSISPSGSTKSSTTAGALNTIQVTLAVEADAGTTMTVLNNIEHSIREFNVDRATIEWSNNGALNLRATATAYFMNKSEIQESETTISPEGKDKK